ncbi:MAG: TolC family protein [Candidatus Lindowbacteria bacterium]|nr:TolC family protein [Candidatus Lindowbacteria bacterium]
MLLKIPKIIFMTIMFLVLVSPVIGANDPVYVEIKSGDTLYSLAREHFDDASRWQDIALLNELTPPYELVVGDLIAIPNSNSESIDIITSVTASQPATMPKRPVAEPTTMLAVPASQPAVFDAAPEQTSHEAFYEDMSPESTNYEDLADLIRIAQKNNREILAARAYAEAADARIKPAGSLEDPTLSVGYMEGNGFDDVPSLGKNLMSRINISIEQMFPGPGKRVLRREIAEHMWKHKGAEVDAVRLKVESKIRKLYWEIYRIDKEKKILERTQNNLRSLTAAAQSRYSVGEGNQEDVIRAGLEVSIATERLRMLVQERIGMAAELNAQLNRAPEVVIGTPGEQPIHTLPAMTEMEKIARTSCPLIVALQHVVMHEEAAVRLAEAERLPDWGVTGGVMPRGSLPTMWTIGFKISLPVRQGERQDEWVRGAEANLQGARHKLEAHWREVNARMFSLNATTESARDLVTLYDLSIIPQASLALRSSISSYQVGRADFMTVMSNVVSLRQYEVERARRLAEFHQAVAEIEGILAEPITRNVEEMEL